MNHQTALLIRQAEGEVIRKKKTKTRFNPRLCPELDNIGFHIIREGKCVYCGHEE
jgi:hypothetical protein